MGKRSTGVMSERKEKRRDGSVERYSEMRKRCSRGTTTVISPRNSRTSATAEAFHSLSLCTTGCLSVSCGSTMSSVPEGGRLMSPVERALLPEEYVTGQQNYNVKQHLHKAEDFQIGVDQRPGVKKNCLDVEQNEEQADHVELHGNGLAGVASGPHAALVRLVFLARPLVFADDGGRDYQRPRQSAGEYKHQQQRAIVVEVVAVHFGGAVIITTREQPVK